MIRLGARMTAILRHGQKDMATKPPPRAIFAPQRGDAWFDDMVLDVRCVHVRLCRHPAAADLLARGKVVSRGGITRGQAAERWDEVDLPNSVKRPMRPDVTVPSRRTTIQGAPLMFGAA